LKSSTEDESFVTASEYATSRSSSYHTASECRDHSPWWTDNTERSSVDLDSSDPEQVNVKASLFSPPAYFTSGSFDNSEKSYNFVDQNEVTEKEVKSESESSSSESPPLPPKIASPIEEFPEPPPLISDKKMYTIFESPTSTPSQDGDVIGTNSPFKVSDDNNNLADMSGLSYYYQNIITKQVLKTCL
jgi:hypothetical protein